jgi:hypothetical protein
VSTTISAVYTSANIQYSLRRDRPSNWANFWSAMRNHDTGRALR